MVTQPKVSLITIKSKHNGRGSKLYDLSLNKERSGTFAIFVSKGKIKTQIKPTTPKDQIVNSPLWLLHIFFIN